MTRKIIKQIGLSLIIASIVLNPFTIARIFSLDNDISNHLVTLAIILFEIIILLSGAFFYFMEINKKEYLKNILLLFLSVFILILVMECVFRIFYPQPIGISTTDNFHLKMHPPNQSTIYQTSEFRTSLKFNSWGLRDKEYSLQKSKNMFRILILGDSYTEALQVNLSNIYTELLEEKLNKISNISFEVINSGVSGFGTADELKYLETKGLNLNPDMIILQFTLGNDVIDNVYDNNFYYIKNSNILNKTYKKKYAHKIEDFFGSYSHFAQFLRLSLRKKFSSSKEEWERKSIEYHEVIYKKKSEEDLQKEWNETRLYLKKINNICNDKKIRFAIIFVPLNLHITSEEYDANNAYPNNVLLDFGKEEKIKMLDLTPTFRAESKGNLSLVRWVIDSHWRPKPHQWAADAIYNFLIEEKLINIKEN